MKSADRKAWGARSVLALVFTVAAVIVAAGLAGEVCWRQHVARESAQPAPETAATPAESGQELEAGNALTPTETGERASLAPAQVLSLLILYGRDELHPLRDYQGEGDIPQYHFAIDRSNRIYILGSSRCGMLIIDPAQKSRKVVPFAPAPGFFSAFSFDMGTNSVYFLITNGTPKENQVILVRAEMVDAKLEPREEICIDVSPADRQGLAVEGNQIVVANHKIYFYIHIGISAGRNNEGLEVKEQIYKFSPAGKRLGMLTVLRPEEDLSGWRNKPLLLGRDGAIWQVLAMNDGWRINKWSM